MKRFNYFVSDAAPNGTRDLYIFDTHTGTEHFIEEAVFGGNYKPVKNANGEYLCHDGYSIGYAPLNADTYLLFPVTLKDVMRHIAVSPLNDGMDTVRAIQKIRGRK